MESSLPSSERKDRAHYRQRKEEAPNQQQCQAEDLFLPAIFAGSSAACYGASKSITSWSIIGAAEMGTLLTVFKILTLL